MLEGVMEGDCVATFVGLFCAGAVLLFVATCFCIRIRRYYKRLIDANVQQVDANIEQTRILCGPCCEWQKHFAG